MAIDTKERTFEQEIEYWLTQGAKKADRYAKGNSSAFSREFAMDTGAVIAFIKDTQPTEWAALVKRHGAASEDGFLRRLNAELNNRGMIDVLRHGYYRSWRSCTFGIFQTGERHEQECNGFILKERIANNTTG
jgi:type I restriction enzyme R subunit